MTPAVNLETVNLSHGSHSPTDGEYCAMEAVSVAAGEPFSDRPDCSCPVIAAWVRTWQDDLTSDEERNRLIRPLLRLLIGTRTTKTDEERRAWMALDWQVRVQAPAWLDLAKLSDDAKALRGLPEVDSRERALSSMAALEAARKKSDAAWAAARDAAWAAARDAAWDAARDAAGAAARDAAGAAARDAAGDAAWAAAWDAAGDAAARDAAARAAAARAAAGDAARAAARDAAWAAAGDAARAAARDAAWAAAGAAARDALAPVVARLQTSAQDLVRRMCEVGR